MESDTDIEVKKTHCNRCGECCLATGPSLQKSDLPLFFNGLIDGTHLYAIRKGELVRDNINDELKFTDQEIVKVRDRKNKKGCVFYDSNEKTCTIYSDRPSQCRAFGCWDDSEFKRVFSGPKAQRVDIIRDSNLLPLIAAHNEKCGYATIARHVKEIQDQGETAVQEILKILRYDQQIRRLTQERLAIDPSEMDLLFGRPLTETIHMFGLTVEQEADGAFLLTVEKT